MNWDNLWFAWQYISKTEGWEYRSSRGTVLLRSKKPYDVPAALLPPRSAQRTAPVPLPELTSD